MISDEAKRQKYLETSIVTASKEDLILKIFDILILSATQARDRFYDAANDVETIHAQLRRAQRALALLMGSLDFDIGGDIAKNLFRVYEWWHHELVLANMQRDPSRIERLLPDFKDYREMWVKAIAEFRAAQRAETASLQPQTAGFSAVG